MKVDDTIRLPCVVVRHCVHQPNQYKQVSLGASPTSVQKENASEECWHPQPTPITTLKELQACCYLVCIDGVRRPTPQIETICRLLPRLHHQFEGNIGHASHVNNATHNANNLCYQHVRSENHSLDVDGAPWSFHRMCAHCFPDAPIVQGPHLQIFR